MSLSVLSNNILARYNNSSLNELADLLPSALTTDAHILEGSWSFAENEIEKTFHELSLSHSTNLYHRYLHNSLRAQMKTNSGDCLEDLSSKGSLLNIKRPSTPNETLDVLKSLPSDWTIVQITCEDKMSGDERVWRTQDDSFPDPTLFISRATCGPSPSLIVQKVSPPSKNNEVIGYLEELTSIKLDNKNITKYLLDEQSKYVSKREEINNRMKNLVESMESAWLRHLSCLLQGKLHPSDEQKLESIIKALLDKNNISLTHEKLQFLMLMVMYPPPSSTSFRDIRAEFPLLLGVSFILELPLRSKIVSKVTKSIREIQKEILPIRKSQRSPLILILDKAVVSLPWEMLYVTKNQPISRMPSLHSLQLLYLYHSQDPNSVVVKGVDPSCGFYILDPEQNLPRSQERLKDSFESTKWPGIVGRKPSTDEFKDALSSKDILVYSGHGSGSQYLPGAILESLESRSLVLLYGCSSAGYTQLGSIPDPFGAVLNYLISYCPCVVGMMWEVMDKDTDRLTKEMLRAIMGQPGPRNSPLEDPPNDVSLLVARARPLCDWYMIGASLVCYGLPLHIVSNK